jgi:hypothetical protein
MDREHHARGQESENDKPAGTAYGFISMGDTGLEPVTSRV